MRYTQLRREHRTSDLREFLLCLLIVSAIIFPSSSEATNWVDPAMEFLISESTSSSPSFFAPSINGDIVSWWQGWEGGGGIYYKNLETGEQHQISNSISDSRPSVYDGTIVWANHGPVGGTETGIYSFDTETGERKRLVSSPPQPYPKNAKIYGDTIVWHGSTAANPDAVSGYNLSSNQVFEIAKGNDVYSVGIYGDTVVWGSQGIYAKNLTTGETRKLVDETSSTIGTIWPYGVLIHDDVVVWINQVDMPPPIYLSRPGIYGTSLSTGELFTVHADPSYMTRTLWTDMNDEIVLWEKVYSGGPTHLWATDIFSGLSFPISEAGQIYGAGIYEDLVVYSRDGSIYGNYISQTPVPEPTTMLLLASGLAGLAVLRRRFKK